MIWQIFHLINIYARERQQKLGLHPLTECSPNDYFDYMKSLFLSLFLSLSLESVAVLNLAT